MTGVDQRDCERLTGQLDLYLDQELPDSEMTRMAEHLESCARCQEEANERIALQTRLRKAAHGIPVPDDYASRALMKARGRSSAPYRNPGYMMIAAAAVITISVAAYQLGHLRTSVASQDGYIARISGETTTVMRVGLKDHVHCAVFRKFPATPPSLDEMASKLGAEFSDLLPVVQSHVPNGMKVVLAHKCRYRGRQYVHLVAREGNNLISLVIARRDEGEAFESDLRAVVTGSDISMYSAGVREFSIAGFETPEHLVYLVSRADQKRNLQMMQTMAVQIRQILRKSEG